MSRTSLRPVTLHPWVYVLRCKSRENTNYPSLYVGISLDVHKRITQHFTGHGARFTQAHAPEAVEALHVDVDGGGGLDRERQITLQLMRAHVEKHGEDAWRSVAGAGWSMPHTMTGPPREF